MFVLYDGKVVDLIPYTAGLTCKQVHAIITGHHNDNEREKIDFYDGCKKSVKVQRTVKRSQISDRYFNNLKQSGFIKEVKST